jgi:Fe-S cluster assembly ATP-binding protein
MGGRIVKSGGPELAHELEDKGYEGARQELGVAATTDEAEAEPAAQG